ncbi:PAS/PAC sensor hybrid histidine kinase [Gloeocapsa sp. PCC 7428]|uniref:ATP-binding protein n=1 Tax=Gloeocapsa sp. PCC 7428 TaxID=1173026 RepID=UPI0002A5E64B|nr:ATP-binding protein [Gloeocapsa sp. PCC 7428]AFZ32468.1 PAS/PAC sensor hybrid histidine kinase [Gloeocapsa sp. PCC 7428]
MNGDEFIKQIQDVYAHMTELQQNANLLPSPQQSQITTALEQLSTALRELQVTEETIRLLLSAVQQSRDSILITTEKLDPPGPEIVYVNPAFSQMTGYAIEEVLGKTPRLLQGANTNRKVLKDLRKHLLEGIPFHGEAINYHKDGTEFFVEWNITPIRNINHSITHFIAIQRDITTRKHMEQERDRLLQREQAMRTEAEAANRVKDEFLATLSHELRTPLTPILGWSKLLQSNKLPEDKLQEALVSIEQHAKRQAQLVDDLLDISRIIQGKLTLNLTAVSLVTPISEALETVRLAAEAKSIQIKTTLNATVGQVMGDASRLQQVIWNLLSNAIKFTPESGLIAVELERVERCAQVTISDNGQGIQPDFLPYVFDRFRQEDSSITRRFGGLGLGLAISRQIIEAHGGTIAVQSPGVGQGATFILKLPLITTPQKSPANTEQPKPDLDLSHTKVLVVEDDAGTQEFVTFVLEQYRAKVTRASTAVDALNTLPRFQPDLLVIDIGLPQIDGYTLMRQIRNLSPEKGGQIPAIALTAYASDRDRQQALAAGFQKHLPKPIEPYDLVAVVAELTKYSNNW